MGWDGKRNRREAMRLKLGGLMMICDGLRKKTEEEKGRNREEERLCQRNKWAAEKTQVINGKKKERKS